MNSEYIGRVPHGLIWELMMIFSIVVFVKTLQDKQGLLICSPHEISYRNNWITKKIYQKISKEIKILSILKTYLSI